ncbi:MAG TPA: TIR domain-containing protein [Chloroflexia bacterium]|jgi:hypothetical protein
MTTLKSTPSIFIGSSSEGKEVAEYLQLALEEHFETTIWSQGVFGLAQGTLNALMKASKTYDYAVLILSPDDTLTKRGITQATARDNVIFELGLFMGSLGQEKIFIVYCADDNINIPADLAGITTARYRRHRNGDLQPALGPVALKIRNAINEIEAASELGPLSGLILAFTEEDQRKIVRPVLAALRDAIAWYQTFDDKAMFDSVRNQVLGDIQRIGRRRLTFRPPKLWEHWYRLVESVDEKLDEICLVSNNDLRYWMEAISDEETEARNYSLVLKKFAGRKTRILILKGETLRDKTQEDDAVEVVKSMIADGFRVLIVQEEDIRQPPDPFPRVWLDFGIIGDLAVSFFDQDEGEDISRSLVESFDDNDKRKAARDWQALLALARWDSGGPESGGSEPGGPDGNSDMGFREWLRRYRIRKPPKQK